MHLYTSQNYEGGILVWHRTLAEAHKDAKNSVDRRLALVQLIDYPANQQAFCDLFNQQRPEGKVLRRWKITPRGGLFELKEGESASAVEANDDEQPAAPTKDAGAFWSELEAAQKHKAPHVPASKPSATE